MQHMVPSGGRGGFSAVSQVHQRAEWQPRPSGTLSIPSQVLSFLWCLVPYPLPLHSCLDERGHPDLPFGVSFFYPLYDSLHFALSVSFYVPYAQLVNLIGVRYCWLRITAPNPTDIALTLYPLQWGNGSVGSGHVHAIPMGPTVPRTMSTQSLHHPPLLQVHRVQEFLAQVAPHPHLGLMWTLPKVLCFWLGVRLDGLCCME